MDVGSARAAYSGMTNSLLGIWPTLRTSTRPSLETGRQSSLTPSSRLSDKGSLQLLDVGAGTLPNSRYYEVRTCSRSHHQCIGRPPAPVWTSLCWSLPGHCQALSPPLSIVHCADTAWLLPCRAAESLQLTPIARWSHTLQRMQRHIIWRISSWLKALQRASPLKMPHLTGLCARW